MTANRMTTIWCDESPAAAPMTCGQWVTGDRAVDARDVAKAAGWKVAQPGGRDYCPDHHPESDDIGMNS